jgi:hypothetical protein
VSNARDLYTSRTALCTSVCQQLCAVLLKLLVSTTHDLRASNIEGDYTIDVYVAIGLVHSWHVPAFQQQVRVGPTSSEVVDG